MTKFWFYVFVGSLLFLLGVIFWQWNQGKQVEKGNGLMVRK